MRFEALQVPLRLVSEAKLLWRLYRHPLTPRKFKALVWVLFLYLLLPFDIIPDFIPILGQLDDLVIIIIGCKLLVRLCPPEVVEECRKD